MIIETRIYSRACVARSLIEIYFPVGLFEIHRADASSRRDTATTQWRNVTSVPGNESLRHSYCESTRLRIFRLAARPGRISCRCLRFIDSNRLLVAETERESELTRTASHPNCKSRGIIFSGLQYAASEVKIHRRDLPLRTLQDDITRHLPPLWHSYIPIVNDNSILRRCSALTVIFTLLKLENCFIIIS